MSILEAHPENNLLVPEQIGAAIDDRPDPGLVRTATGRLAVEGAGSVNLAESAFDVGASPYRVDKKPEALIRGLYDQVLAQRERNGGDFGPIAAIRMESNSPFADVARYVEAVWFKDWYPEHTPEKFAHEMHEEYGPYERDSHFVLLIDTENADEDGLPKLAGMARAVGGRVDLLKTVNDMPGVWEDVSREEILHDLTICDAEACVDVPVGDPAGTWDYSSLAVAKDYRGSRAYEMLSHELFGWSVENSIHTVTTILVERFYKLYKYIGVPFREIAGVEPKEHMRIVSVPAVMHMPEAWQLSQSSDTKLLRTWQALAVGDQLDHFRTTA